MSKRAGKWKGMGVVNEGVEEGRGGRRRHGGKIRVKR
jgi:hypothetical protein